MTDKQQRKTGAKKGIQLPLDILKQIEMGQSAKAWSDATLLRQADIAKPTLRRLRRSEASWDTIVAVCLALEIPVPVLVPGGSPAARLWALSHRDERRYLEALRVLDSFLDGK